MFILNDDTLLQYTAYWITDAKGTPLTSIQVDGLLDPKDMERVLAGDLR